jgi:chemotaxis protein MotB
MPPAIRTARPVRAGASGRLGGWKSRREIIVPLANRRSRRSNIDIWPGFVDALAQLLMVIIFILLVFTAGQFLLSDALSGRDKALHELQQQISELSDLLALERSSGEQLRANAATLSAQLKASIAERDTLTTQLAALAAKSKEDAARADELSGKLRDADAIVSADKDKIELQLRELASLRRDIEALRAVRVDLEKQVAGLAAAQQQSAQETGALRDRSKELEAKLASAEERTALAQKQIDARDIRLRELTTQGNEARTKVDELNSAIAALRQQLAAISAALGVSESKVKDQQTQIADLGKRLNLALANKVQELARYRSEFFGRLREIIGDRPDIHVVGDRFVFQSEVLFDPGNAELSDAAKKQLDPVIAALKEIAAKIPKDLNWVLRVDGHTDKRPISNAQFASNWELSAARAISVVRYLISQGVPPNRLVAAGFADFQPLDTGDTEEAYRRNRRIELKLTE